MAEPTKDELVARAEELGLDTDGTKAELEERIAAAEAGGDTDQPVTGDQAQADRETEAGYVGTKVDPRPNEAYSLESGPDSPSALEATRPTVDELAGNESTAPSDEG